MLTAQTAGLQFLHQSLTGGEYTEGLFLSANENLSLLINKFNIQHHSTKLQTAPLIALF